MNGILFIYLNFRRLSGLNTETFHVKMSINEEIGPFPHYIVVNQCDVDELEWISKILMVYGLMDCYLCI